MKVQCSCGAKYAFEISPEMRTNPIRFSCSACGLDASEFVDALIRQELGQSATPHGRVITVEATSDSVMPQQTPPSSAEPHEKNHGARVASPPSPTPLPSQSTTSPPRAPLRVHLAPLPQPSDVHPSDSEESPHCPKHPNQEATEKCYVCSKPICPQCMELFGYLCSPLCKAKADAHGIKVPIYEGQRSVIESRRWRRIAWVGWSAGALAVALLAFWIWYSWFGSAPKVVFSIRFPEPAYSGQSAFAGKDQIIFLHGGTLARHDMHQKVELWRHYLIDKNEIQTEVAKEIEETKALIYKANNEAWGHVPKMPDPEKLALSLERSAAASLELRVSGQNIWVVEPKKLVRYDWDTGKPAQEIPIPPGYGSLIARGEELLLMNAEAGRPIVTSINLTTCGSRTIEVGGQEIFATSGRKDQRRTSADKAGLPTGMPGRDAGKPMDPAKVAQQAQHMSGPAKIALPAVLANSWSQERTLAELDDQQRPNRPSSAAPPQFRHVTLIPSKDGFLEFSSQLLEHKTISHSAAKPAAAGKSVLEGPVNVTQSSEVANEILNEMQRERGGDIVEEDLSRYQVTLRRAGTTDVWTGEVIGNPSLFPLQSVNVLAANKQIIVFDKSNKKLWQSPLNFNLSGALEALDPQNSPYGQGPCVERNESLFVFDEGVLTAFDLKTGNARWRLPSVGITGIFFDERGMMYVNTTTANPERLKFSRQININQKTSSVVLKIDPANGKTLWTGEPGGLVNYVSGKYIYAVQTFTPDEEDDNPYQQESGLLPHVQIKRLNPRNGHEMWEHYQQRAPVDVQFDKNTIRLVFKKEVQVLKCLSW